MDLTWKSLSIAVAVLAGFGLVLIWVLGAQSKREVVVGLNQEIQFDDFAFSALGTRKASALGGQGDQKPSEGLYYVVTFKIANHARRVDFEYNPTTTVLVDGAGREYRVSAQEGACKEAIPAGGYCVTELVFDVPADINNPHIKMSFGKVGDFLDTIFYGKRKIALEPQGRASQ
ncbi:MAG TPA: DUF4352 domain-containing protein [Blastocatellia bacterium]|nr:DUF4352 domain-containing protein [Blastocatellia bacterium]